MGTDKLFFHRMAGADIFTNIIGMMHISEIILDQITFQGTKDPNQDEVESILLIKFEKMYKGMTHPKSMVPPPLNINDNKY
ncbi:hypothetical protein [Desulfoluna spongiiphila]|uniref:hypothetical protein n=1 Tax=Desulfoluna spongiiphila TaxID=419481 RepID=UPI00125F06C4|nr:hypothetical protein [Desulfoluna spongiiphila]